MSFPHRPVLAFALVAGATTALAAQAIPSDHTAPRAASTPAAVRVAWTDSDAGSVARLREIIAAQTGEAAVTLARCRGATDRPTFMRCALPTLAMLGAAGQLNASILSRIGQDNPDARCSMLIRTLAGSVGFLGMVARNTLRNELPATASAADVAAASRTVAALARDTRRLAHDRAWRLACDPAPPATA